MRRTTGAIASPFRFRTHGHESPAMIVTYFSHSQFIRLPSVGVGGTHWPSFFSTAPMAVVGLDSRALVRSITSAVFGERSCSIAGSQQSSCHLSLKQFRQLPQNPAFKYEYINQVAWISPGPKFYSARLDLNGRSACLPEMVHAAWGHSHSEIRGGGLGCSGAAVCGCLPRGTAVRKPE